MYSSKKKTVNTKFTSINFVWSQHVFISQNLKLTTSLRTQGMLRKDYVRSLWQVLICEKNNLFDKSFDQNIIST